MEQKINKKLVKQLRDGKIAVNNDWTLEKLIRILKKASTQRPLQLHNPSTYYYFVSGNLTGSSHINILKPHSVSDFFKPAKVKLKDVDKSIWFPDAKKVFKYTKDVEFYGKLIVSNTPFFEDDYIDYKDIKWPKTKSSIEDRVTALEKESAANKAANLLLGLQNVAVNAENSMLRQYKKISHEDFNNVHSDYKAFNEKIVTPSAEFKEPVSAIKVTHDAGVKPSITVHLTKDENGKITDKTEINKEPIDWNKPQYLVSERGKVVLSTGKHSNEYFDAIKFGDENYVRRIQYVKKYYKPFKGTITV